ncbi:MAG: GNAT family N-acetyltransferase [Spirochaetaceae bacterium]
MDENLEKLLRENRVLKSDRITLRPFTIEDVEDFFEVSSDVKVSEYLTWGPHTHIDQAKDSIENRFCNNIGVYAIELKPGNKCLGCIDLRVEEDHKKASFGFMLNKNYWGHGYMTETLLLVLKLCFGTLKLNRVESSCYKGNEGSGRVMEKCGMKLEGFFKQELIVKERLVDVYHYGILAEDFKN